MAYVPLTPVSPGGEAVSSWANQVGDNLEFLFGTPSSAKWRTSSLTILDNTETDISYNATGWLHGMTATVSTEILVETPGIYLATLNVQWENNSTGARHIQIVRDGIAKARDITPASTFSEQSVVLPFVLTSGSTAISSRVLQTSGVSLSIIGTAERSPLLSVTMLRPL